MRMWERHSPKLSMPSSIRPQTRANSQCVVLQDLIILQAQINPISKRRRPSQELTIHQRSTREQHQQEICQWIGACSVTTILQHSNWMWCTWAGFMGCSSPSSLISWTWRASFVIYMEKSLNFMNVCTAISSRAPFKGSKRIWEIKDIVW